MPIFAPLKLRLNGNLEDYEVGIDLKRERRRFGSQRVFSFLVFICMIQDKCCIIRNIETGVYEFYESWTELAKKLGVSRQFVYKCRDSGVECRGYTIMEKMKNRVYLVKKKEGKATLCYINIKKRTVTEIATGRVFPFRLVEDIKDMTYHYMNEKSLMDEFIEL